MSDHPISWTDRTWNPLLGCREVSPGCANCYARKMSLRLKRIGRPEYRLVVEERSGQAAWTGRSSFVQKRLDQPLRWKKPRRIFVCSMSDLFFEGHDFERIAAVFEVMAKATRHQFQVLTKRPERAIEWLRWFRWIDERGDVSFGPRSRADLWPLPNVSLGVSVESADHLDRVGELIEIPAAARFISYEPALGPVDWTLDGVGLLIAGGESGPRARPASLSWFRSARDACREAGTAFHMKQLGASVILDSLEDSLDLQQLGWSLKGNRLRPPKGDLAGKKLEHIPEDLRIREDLP